jgi:hypothetical protein
MRILAAAALAAMTLLCAPAEAGSEPQTYYHPALLGSLAMPPLPNVPLYWLVERFPSRKAAEGASGQTGIAIEKDRKFWLFSIRRQGDWSSGSVHVTQVGPLPPNTPVRLVTTSAHRRAFFMVLHDTTKPWEIPSNWHPTHLCDASS